MSRGRTVAGPFTYVDGLQERPNRGLARAFFADRLWWTLANPVFVGMPGARPASNGTRPLWRRSGHRDEAWETRLVVVKLELPVDKRFFVRTGDTLRSSTLSLAWAPNQSNLLRSTLPAAFAATSLQRDATKADAKAAIQERIEGF